MSRRRGRQCRRAPRALARAGFFLWLLVALSAPVWAVGPEDRVLEYQILRGGWEIGRHRVEIRRLGDRLTVETQVRIAVKFAFITVYRYALDARETWRDGRLVALESVTDDDGKRYAVSAVSEGDVVRVDNGGAGWTAPATIVPSSLWRRDMLESNLLIGIKRGNALAVSVAEAGRETVTVHGRPLSATRYVVSGDLTRELWYGPDGMLVRVRFFTGRDGSEIVYVLR